MKKETKAMLDDYKYVQKMVPIAEILIDKVETKNGLGRSLTILGHTTDVVLNEFPMLTEGKKYRVIDGRKTINALIGENKKKVMARVYNNLPVDLEKYVLLVRNLQRSHSPVVEAESFQELINQGKSQKDISEITGIQPSIISQRLALLRLPRSILDRLRRNEITYSAAKRIGGLPLDVQNRIAGEEKITGELVEQHHREFLNSQLSFDDMDLPEAVRGTAVVRSYHVRCGETDKSMTRKELLSFVEEVLPGLSGGDELVIKRM